MEHTPPTPNFETPRPEEHSGLFERWRKKAKKAEETPRAGQAEAQEARPKKTARDKFTENVASFLFGRPPKGERASSTDGTARQNPEQAASGSETEPLIDRASRMRRFARQVINHVMGTARSEQEHAREWDGKPPLNTEPLVDAAEDLGEAAEDLDDAARAYSGYSGGSGDGGGPDAPNWQQSAGRGPEDSFAARMAERFTRRVEDLEEKLQAQTLRAERGEVRAVAARSALGMVALLGVVLVGHEYLAHKKIKKEQKSQREVQVELRAESILQNQRLQEMTRRERAAHYERISKLTHLQAAETREVTRELRQEVTEKAPQILHVPHNEEIATVSQNEAWQPARQRAPAEIAAQPPEQYIMPVVTVEKADTIEYGPSQASRKNDAGQMGGGSNGSPAQPSNMLRQDDLSTKVPLSPAAQRELAARKLRAQRLVSNAWVYGVALVVGLVAVAAIIIALT
jgi:hypothetical protein